MRTLANEELGTLTENNLSQNLLSSSVLVHVLFVKLCTVEWNRMVKNHHPNTSFPVRIAVVSTCLQAMEPPGGPVDS